MISYIDVQEAQSKFIDLLRRIHNEGETIIIEYDGKPLAAVISVEYYEQLMAAREARFTVIDRIRANTPLVSEDEVVRDVTEAITAVRAGG